jgi:hypothetical protein
MNSVVWQAIDKQLQSLNSVVWQAIDKQLQSLPVFHDCYSLDQATFDAIETRLLTHFSVSVARFGTGGSTRARKTWVSLIKLKYSNDQRLMFAQYITQVEENTCATRKALLVLDARETINRKLKEQTGTLWHMALTTCQECLCSNLGLALTLPNFCRKFAFSVLCGRLRQEMPVTKFSLIFCF